MDASFFDEVTPAIVMRTLDGDIAHLHIQIGITEEDLQSMRDVKMPKAWLKALPKQPSQRDDDLFWET